MGRYFVCRHDTLFTREADFDHQALRTDTGKETHAKANAAQRVGEMLAAAARLRSAGKAVEMCRGLVGTKAKHTLPDLPYDYGALEPVISGEIMELHHSKHHQAYVNGVQGSGWGWLGYDTAPHQLYVKTMANQNPL